MKALVVFFSRTGHTRQVAGEIVQLCGADLGPIRELRGRQGVWGALRSIWQAMRRAAPPILPSVRNPADYDLVIIGSPIWGMRLAPPVRSYARQHAAEFKHVAFFCTEGGSGHQNAFSELADICGKEPVATLVVTESELPEPAHSEPLRGFLARLARA
jgi:flavodoxin